MRKILLAGAAMLATTGLTMAAGTTTVNLSSEVTKNCSVTGGGAVTLGPAAGSVNSTFSTTCNFSAANITVAFKSDNGGLLNSVESVTADYEVTYDAVTKLASDIDTGFSTFTTAPSGGSPNVAQTRNFSVNLPAALTVGGTYADVLTIQVSP